jgi:prepilin-type N-terminal cleavage/methylation domain-containing protein
MTRRGMSLLEIVIALAILLVAVLTLVDSLSASRDTAARLDVLITGQLLAESILDTARHHFQGADSRFHTLGTPPETLIVDAATGKWKLPFLALAQRRTVVTAPGPYFDAVKGPVLPDPAAEPAAHRWLSRFSYEVRVQFEVAGATGQVPIDADGDGKPEIDVGELAVEVFYTAGPGEASRSAALLKTLLTAPDKAPGAGALTSP